VPFLGGLLAQKFPFDVRSLAVPTGPPASSSPNQAAEFRSDGVDGRDVPKKEEHVDSGLAFGCCGVKVLTLSQSMLPGETKVICRFWCAEPRRMRMAHLTERPRCGPPVPMRICYAWAEPKGARASPPSFAYLRSRARQIVSDSSLNNHYTASSCRSPGDEFEGDQFFVFPGGQPVSGVACDRLVRARFASRPRQLFRPDTKKRNQAGCRPPAALSCICFDRVNSVRRQRIDLDARGSEAARKAPGFMAGQNWPPCS